MNKYIKVSIIILFFGFGKSISQEGKLVLTFQQCLILALQNNLSIKTITHRTDEARADFHYTKSMQYPKKRGGR